MGDGSERVVGRDAAQDDVANEAIQSANRRLWGTAFGSLVLVGVFCFVIVSWPTSYGRFDIGVALKRLGALAGLVEESRVDPAGLLGTFGAVAIAASFAVIDGARRLSHRLDNEPEHMPKRRREQLRQLEQAHVDQIVTISEFLILALVSGGGLALTLTFADAGEGVLALTAGFLTALLWVETWRFLTIFYRVDRIEFRIPAELLRDRLRLLLQANGVQKVTAWVWRVCMPVHAAVLAGSLQGVGVDSTAAMALAVLSVGAGYWVCEAARSAIFEVRVARFVTFLLTAVSAMAFSVLPPLLAAFDAQTTLSAPPQEAAVVWLLVASAATLVLVPLRAADRAGFFPQRTTVGLSLIDRLKLPPRASERSGCAPAGAIDGSVDRRGRGAAASLWLTVGWQVLLVCAIAVPVLVLGGAGTTIFSIALVVVLVCGLAGAARWSTTAMGVVRLTIAGMLVLVLSGRLFALAAVQAVFWAEALLTVCGVGFFYGGMFLLLRIGAGSVRRRSKLTTWVDLMQIRYAKHLRARLRGLGLKVQPLGGSFMVEPIASAPAR